MSLDPKKITALTISEYFIDKANKDGKSVTNKKLQKLVYYAQAWSLVLRNKKLFDEKIEAWVHGPAIKSLYLEYKKFGFSPIKKEADRSISKSMSPINKKLLDSVWSVYGNLDADYLEMLTHKEAPWQEAREGLESSENSENEISVRSMKIFYTQKLENTKK
jgi:uncharacterized phage-associated protein